MLPLLKKHQQHLPSPPTPTSNTILSLFPRPTRSTSPQQSARPVKKPHNLAKRLWSKNHPSSKRTLARDHQQNFHRFLDPPKSSLTLPTLLATASRKRERHFIRTRMKAHPAWRDHWNLNARECSNRAPPGRPTSLPFRIDPQAVVRVSQVCPPELEGCHHVRWLRSPCLRRLSARTRRAWLDQLLRILEYRVT